MQSEKYCHELLLFFSCGIANSANMALEHNSNDEDWYENDDDMAT